MTTATGVFGLCYWFKAADVVLDPVADHTSMLDILRMSGGVDMMLLASRLSSAQGIGG